jgi:hypothetical protein
MTVKTSGFGLEIFFVMRPDIWSAYEGVRSALGGIVESCKKKAERAELIQFSLGG